MSDLKVNIIKPFKVALIAVTNKLVRPVLTITTINSIYRWICPG